MELTDMLIPVGLVFLPIIGYVVLSEKRMLNNPLVKVLLMIVGLIALAFVVSMFMGFHVAAFILQIYIPYLLVVGAVLILVGIIVGIAKAVKKNSKKEGTDRKD